MTILILYVVIAVLVYGYMFACWQRAYPTISYKDYVGDMLISILFAALWPSGLTGFLISWRHQKSLYYGFKFW